MSYNSYTTFGSRMRGGGTQPTRPRRSSRRFTKGVVEPADLKVVFQHFERLDDGLMGLEAFQALVQDLKLNLRDHEVKRLFRHLCSDVALAASNNTFFQSQSTDRTTSYDDGASDSTNDDDHVRGMFSVQRGSPPRNSFMSMGRTGAEERINAEQFLAGIRRHRFLRRIVSVYF